MSSVSDRWIHIDDKARSVKALFKDRPGENILQEIREYIRNGGEPYLWRGHTHTEPPRNDPVEYLTDFEVPRQSGDETRLAPCPCCWPNHRKYGRGMVAWFPVEGVIRLMGATCFAGLNKEGHEKALRELARLKKERAEVAYLLGSGDKLVRARDLARSALPVAAAIDDFGRDLRYRLDKGMNMPLWQQTKAGELYITDEGVRRRYATVKGTEIMNPSPSRFTPRVRQVVQALDMIPDVDQWELQVKTMPERDRTQAAKIISASIRTARTVFEQMRDRQAFVGQETVATIRRWGTHPESVFPITFDRKGEYIRVARPGLAVNSIRIPPEMEAELGELDAPLLSEIQVEE